MSRGHRRTRAFSIVVLVVAALGVQAARAGWDIQTVEAGGDVGRYPSLCFYDGNPVISYFDVTNNGLKVASWNGSQWVAQTIEAGGVGQYPSLAIDASGHKNISYYDVTNGALKYAGWIQSNWTWAFQTPDQTGDVGRYPAFVFDQSGRPVLAYYDATNGNLVASSWNGSSWTREVIESQNDIGQYPSLAIDASGHKNISYYDVTNGALKYAGWIQSNWTWAFQAPDQTGDVGRYPALAFDQSGRPAITYYDAGNGDLVASSWNGSSWTRDVIESQNDIGQYTSLAIDASGHKNVSYYDVTNGALKYAGWIQPNWTWAFQAPDQTGNVGQYPSLAFDANARPCISYYDASQANLKFAWWDGSLWSTEAVDMNGSVGQYTSIAVDPLYKLGIAYYYADSGDLRYAEHPAYSPLPDLQLLPTSTATPPARLYFSNVSVLWGYNYTVEYPYTDKQFVGAVVRNTGIVPVDSVLVRFYVDSQPIGDTTIGHMGPGDTAVVDRTWDLPNPATENKTVEVRIDPDNKIQEYNEGNNDASEQVSIYYAKRDRDTLPPQYDLRTDGYSFQNFGWDSEDPLWAAFNTYILHGLAWTSAEQALLGMLYSLYAVAGLPTGNCLGMAATSIHYFDHPELIPAPYHKTFVVPKADAEARIKEYQCLQFLEWMSVTFASELHELGLLDPSPSAQFTSLKGEVAGNQEPTMLCLLYYNPYLMHPGWVQHATACYKIVERGRFKTAYYYENNDDISIGSTTSARPAVFDVNAERFWYGGDDFLAYRAYCSTTDEYPGGFPQWFVRADDLTKRDSVLARRPRLDLGSWAQTLLWDIWDAYVRRLTLSAQHMLALNCPVNGLVTDNHGRRIGFVGDTLVNEIPGASIDTGFAIELYNLPDSLSYTLTTAAYDSGPMAVRFSLRVRDSTFRLVTFDSVPLQPATKATLSFARSDTSFPMAVDWDGGGTADTTISPDFNDIIGNPPGAVREPVRSEPLPTRFDLQVSSPLAAGLATTIRYMLPRQAVVRLVVYDAFGRLVKTLTAGPRQAGIYTAAWDGTDGSGKSVSHGAYFVDLRANEKRLQRKVVLVR